MEGKKRKAFAEKKRNNRLRRWEGKRVRGQVHFLGKVLVAKNRNVPRKVYLA